MPLRCVCLCVCRATAASLWMEATFLLLATHDDAKPAGRQSNHRIGVLSPASRRRPDKKNESKFKPMSPGCVTGLPVALHWFLFPERQHVKKNSAELAAKIWQGSSGISIRPSPLWWPPKFSIACGSLIIGVQVGTCRTLTTVGREIKSWATTVRHDLVPLCQPIT